MSRKTKSNYGWITWLVILLAVLGAGFFVWKYSGFWIMGWNTPGSDGQVNIRLSKYYASCREVVMGHLNSTFDNATCLIGLSVDGRAWNTSKPFDFDGKEISKQVPTNVGGTFKLRVGCNDNNAKGALEKRVVHMSNVVTLIVNCGGDDDDDDDDEADDEDDDEGTDSDTPPPGSILCGAMPAYAPGDCTEGWCPNDEVCGMIEFHPEAPHLNRCGCVGNCYDTDGGYDPYKKGTCTDTDSTETEVCPLGNGGAYVTEIWCVTAGCWGASVECGSGYKCWNAACVSETLDSDGDGVTDLIEMQSGFDPNDERIHPFMNCLDLDGSGPGLVQYQLDSDCWDASGKKSDYCGGTDVLHEYICLDNQCQDTVASCTQFFGQDWGCSLDKCYGVS